MGDFYHETSKSLEASKNPVTYSLIKSCRSNLKKKNLHTHRIPTSLARGPFHLCLILDWCEAPPVLQHCSITYDWEAPTRESTAGLISTQVSEEAFVSQVPTSHWYTW